MNTPSLTFTERIIKGRWIGKSLLALLLVGTVFYIGSKAVQSPQLFYQQLLNGLQLGFVYALIALGYTMVYGIVKLINFAHGDVFMVGAFVSFFAVTRFNLHTWLGAVFPGAPVGLVLVVGTLTVMILSMIVCAIMAVTIERIAYKPLRNAPRISALITAIGVSFFLEYFGALPFVFTANYITYERPFDVVTWYIKDGVHLLDTGMKVPAGSVTFSSIFIIIVVVSMLLMAGLQFIVQRTKLGKAMRAVSYDKPTARLMGIKVDTVISSTFAIGAALAGAAGILYAVAYGQVSFIMGILPGLKAFVAAVLGGIGSIPGALVGALILGQVETMSSGYISTPMRDAIVFSVLILVLLVRPTGIFGEPEREKA
ncbi:MAG: branched-chain amino acid ABC transporter permease [Anaerolineales bacterium]|jgi:branched-chain amino acid transport system permease protein|nr:branched-chain amino acid ABC transporter permease [Anaerolineales bacterium]